MGSHYGDGLPFLAITYVAYRRCFGLIRRALHEVNNNYVLIKEEACQAQVRQLPGTAVVKGLTLHSLFYHL